MSLADLIVIAGNAASRPRRRPPVTTSRCRSRRVAPTPRRRTPTSTRSPSSSLGPTASATTSAPGEKLPPEQLLVDRAYTLGLSAPELTVLVGGLRAIGVSSGSLGLLGDDRHARRVVLQRPAGTGRLVVHELDRARLRDPRLATARADGHRHDLVFGSNSVLRAIAEVYASADAADRFVADFVKAWVKVMDADRFDVQS